jgi:hypothetical protein
MIKIWPWRVLQRGQRVRRIVQRPALVGQEGVGAAGGELSTECSF